MRNIQKQLCGIALLLFGLIIAVAALALNRMMALLGCAVGLFGLAMTFGNREGFWGEDMTFWNQDDDEEKTDADDNGK